MRNVIRFAMPAVVLAGQLLAGGFYLQLGNPDASEEARKANAVLTVKATGCHDPATATLTATAVGTVNGSGRPSRFRSPSFPKSECSPCRNSGPRTENG